MATLSIPEGYQQVMPYLILQNAAQFLSFMEKVFGATEKYKALKDDGSIGHAELQIGESTIMFADSNEQWRTENAGLFIYVADADETYNKAIEAGATSVMPMSDQPYGRTGGVKDPFGNTWWITRAG
jgi:PhnB protein